MSSLDSINVNSNIEQLTKQVSEVEPNLLDSATNDNPTELRLLIALAEIIKQIFSNFLKILIQTSSIFNPNLLQLRNKFVKLRI